MSNFIRISEATSIAFHAAAMIAENSDRIVSSREIASALGASENHLSKVLQRLARSGIVRSTRGPNGGFKIRTPWEKIRLIEIYEAIEGPLAPGRCLLAPSICRGNKCVLGVLVHKTDEAARKCLAGTTLAEIVKSFHPGA
ncbi:MAG: Rrf2 family transcriptional regulator [Candidatus Krumholzibacteria bacterium]|nr:Rrf2 family transcriptional regulator [Candidatus Krumholzibacteria bacterium]